ncbi:MAG: RHS repeat-associated core domain-containing protein [Oculatellaceae cyanobacterium bins.114]|nr:RHS repeat-associated core domain-containing protein [Oculatellaceae cyanobacterium bins.114]
MRHSYTYGAFGRAVSETGSTQNSYQFAGEQFDENLGEYYLRDRYYDQNIGRFTRRDVYEGSLGNLADLNKYVYVSNNPLTGIDPTGMSLINTKEDLVLTDLYRKHLEASYNLQPVIRTYRTARTGMLAIGAIVAGAAVAGGILTVSTARSLNHLLGIPIVFWGSDISQVRDHQFDAVTGSGNTRNNPSGISGASLPIPYTLHRRETEYPRSWRKSQPQYHPTRGITDTDEYPYAIVNEGGKDNYFKGRVSLRTLDMSQNRSNGSRLRIFMNRTLVTTYETNRYFSTFINVPVPGLGMSFGLDRLGRIVPVWYL